MGEPWPGGCSLSISPCMGKWSVQRSVGKPPRPDVIVHCTAQSCRPSDLKRFGVIMDGVPKPSDQYLVYKGDLSLCMTKK